MSVFSLLEKLSYLNHGSLTKQSVVSRETKEYRRALQLLANPTTAYHATSPDSLPDILSSGELKPGRFRDVYGKGVYFGIGLPAGEYYETGGTMFATTNPLKNTVPLIPQHIELRQNSTVPRPRNRSYYWTNTPDAVPISNNKTTFILPAEGDYSDSIRANKLRSISRANFKRAFEATHPGLADWMFYRQASENPASTNRVIGERVLKSLKDVEAIAKSMGGKLPRGFW